MKKRSKTTVRPFTVLVLTILLLVLFAGFALLEYSQSKKDLRSMMEEEGYIVLDVLMASSERSILAYEELEWSVQTRLINSGHWLEEIDFSGNLTKALLDTAAQKMDLYRIHVLDKYGKRLLSNTAPHPQLAKSADTLDYHQELIPLLSGVVEEIIIGFREGKYLSEPRYAVAVKRRKGGAIVIAVDAQRLLSFRQELGPGRLIQEIGNKAGVAYVVLQDTLGIRMASRGVTEMSRILSDPFLVSIFNSNTRATRISTFGEKEIFEIIGPFFLEGDHLGIFRIGLEMEYYRNILRNARYRFFFIALIFIVVGIIGVSLMVASQNVKILSESYQQVKTRTGEILLNLEDAVVAVDGDGVIIIFNEAAQHLFKIPDKKMLGRAITSMNYTFCSILRESLESGQAIAKLQEEIFIKGKKCILSLRTSIVKDDNGKIDAAILVATDLTTQKQLEEQLHRQEKLTAMGELASGVAHEIRNPINAIGMIAQRFLKEFKPKKDENEYRKLAQSVINETHRTNKIITRFLQFAKPPALQLSAVDMQNLLHEISSLFKSSTDSKGIKLIVHNKHHQIMSIDKDQMSQAILNILQNALNATQADATITITASSQPSEYSIAITDEGSGIERENLHKIFDLYYTTKKDGTGMGLPIVSQIIQNHGGTIDVDSEVGKGTTFTIRLPRKDVS